MCASVANSNPVQVGLTGGIGVGKSTVARLWAMQSIPVYEADTAAKHLMNTREDLRQSLIALLGNEAYHANGLLNKAFMRTHVFTNVNLRAEVEARIHPAVQKHYLQWYSTQQAPFVIKVAALLLEKPQRPPLDVIALVCSPWQLRLRRIQARNPHLSIAQIKAIRDSQWPNSRKKKLAHHILYNDEKHSLIQQISALPQWGACKTPPKP